MNANHGVVGSSLVILFSQRIVRLPYCALSARYCWHP